MSYYTATWNHELTDGHWCESHAPVPGADGNPAECTAPGYAGPCPTRLDGGDCIEVFECDEAVDYPVHCAVCDELLSDELTGEGEEYVREQLAGGTGDVQTDGTGRVEILTVWAETWPHLTVPATPAVPDNAATETTGELELAVDYKGRTAEGRCEYRWWTTDTATGRVWSEQDLCSGVGDAPDAEAMLPVLAGFLAADAESWDYSTPDDGFMFGEVLAELASQNADELSMLSVRDELDSDDDDVVSVPLSAITDTDTLTADSTDPLVTSGLFTPKS